MTEEKSDLIDELTGLRNRNALFNSFDFSAHDGRDLYIVVCELDNFHNVNKQVGERRGDEVIARIGQLIQASFGVKHSHRYSGDEFIITNSFVDEDALLEKIALLNKRIFDVESDGVPLNITCSYGYVYGRIRNQDELYEAVRLADRKMFEAKRLGKARTIGAPIGAEDLVGGYASQRSIKSYETDELTGLSNLIHFRSELEHLYAVQKASKELAEPMRLALIYFNIQSFKHYNEQFGFEAGDELLVLIADAIIEAFPGCLAARFSADQFMVAAHVDNVESGILSVRKAFRSRQKDTSIWLKAGVYVPRDDDENIGTTMDRAKLACDSIKGRRDVFYRYYDKELQSQILLHRYVLEYLDQAFEEHWIRVFYQPIIRVATGEICDEEALSRWVDPERGIIAPIDFIPVLEEARLIHRLDLYMVRRACEHLSDLLSRGQVAVPVSVNLSRLDFELCSIVDEVCSIVDEFGLDRTMLSIEVTESAMSGNQEFLKDEIDRFRAEGFEVWMDDFGSGYSSLNLLKEYTFDLIKIDMNFMRDFDTNEQARIILAHIIAMAKELGIKTLVEGVETKEQQEFLSSIGCGRAQGFLFGKPTSLASILESVQEHRYPPIEHPARHGFYEAIGRVNLLRPDPSDPMNGHYVPGDAAAAILRRRAGVYDYLNVTDEFRVFLESVGAGDIEVSRKRINEDGEAKERLDEIVDTCIEKGTWAWATFYEGGELCSVRVKPIAYDENENMVAVLMIASNIEQETHMHSGAITSGIDPL